MQGLRVSPKNYAVILLLTALIVFIFAYLDILEAIVSQWVGDESAGYNHGFLVLICTVYLLYLKREQFSELTPDPQKTGFIPLALFSIILFFSELSEIQALKMLMMPLLILTSIFTILGKQYFRLALVPVLILVFALPIWKPVLPILQDITTWVTQLNLKILGRPAHVVGNYITVTGGTFLVEEACSGLRFLLISVILTLINSDLNSHNRRQGVALFFIAVALALLANWIRVIIIVVIGDVTNMQSSLVHDHVNFGWMVFLVVVLIPYLAISRLIPQNTLTSREQELADVRSRYKPSYFLMTLLIIMSAPLLRHGLALASTNIFGELEAPVAVANWESNDNIAGSSAWKPNYKNATQELFKSYSGKEGVEIDLHVFHYSEQKQGAELINSENTITDESSWNVVPSSEEQHLIQANQEIKSVNTVEVINSSRQKKLIWYWYDVGGHTTSNQYYAKLFQILAQLQGKNYANLVAISIACAGDCHERQQYLENYISGWQILDD
ncbi:MAG: exosortase C-terminal domain/associated protein EpsI [Pseudomonadota bacterium]